MTTAGDDATTWGGPQRRDDDRQMVDVGRVHDLPADAAVAVVDGLVVVVRDGDMVRAWRNQCGHKQRSLDGGRLVAGTLTCPHHLWQYRISDGTCLAGGRDAGLVPVPVEVVAGRVHVARPAPAPSLVEVLRAHAAAGSAGAPRTPVTPEGACAPACQLEGDVVDD